MSEVEIVGIVEDAAYRRVREDFPPTMYRPAAQVTEPAAVPEPDGADGAGRHAGPAAGADPRHPRASSRG